MFPAIAALLWQAPALKAQIAGERRLEFEQFTVNDGLLLNFVTCILQDHQGFMWFGTGNGLINMMATAEAPPDDRRKIPLDSFCFSF